MPLRGCGPCRGLLFLVTKQFFDGGRSPTGTGGGAPQRMCLPPENVPLGTVHVYVVRGSLGCPIKHILINILCKIHKKCYNESCKIMFSYVLWTLGCVWNCKQTEMTIQTSGNSYFNNFQQLLSKCSKWQSPDKSKPSGAPRHLAGAFFDACCSNDFFPSRPSGWCIVLPGPNINTKTTFC